MIFDGGKLRELRTARGLNQTELAVELDVTRQTIHNWETNRNMPNFGQLAKLSRFFGVSGLGFTKEAAE